MIAREFCSVHALCVFGCRACIVCFLSAAVIDRFLVCGRIGIRLLPVVIDPHEFVCMYALCVFGCRAGIVCFLSATVIDCSVVCC